MTTLFKDDRTPVVETVVTDPSQSFLEQLVGEGKKYRDTETLAKSALDKDSYILSIQRENAELRSEVKTRMTLEEFYNKTRPALGPGNQNNTNVIDETPEVIQSVNAAPVDIQKMVAEALTKQMTQTTRTNNLTETRKALEQTWGSTFSLKLQERANELNLGAEFLDDLAGRSPKAFLELVGVSSRETAVTYRGDAPPRSQSVSSLQPSNSNVRNEAWYAKMRKDNPKDYFKPDIQNQRHKDALSMGDKFWN